MGRRKKDEILQDTPDKSIVTLFNKPFLIPTWILLALIVFIGGASLILMMTFQTSTQLKPYMTLNKTYVPPVEEAIEPISQPTLTLSWPMVIAFLIGQIFFVFLIMQRRRFDLPFAIILGIILSLLLWFGMQYFFQTSFQTNVAPMVVNP